MQIFEKMPDMLHALRRIQGKTIGFVPTMGALHQGHISLVRKAKEENDCVICSIYVNPTQFNNAEDLQKYPKTLDSDISLLKMAGCDILFVPQTEEIYPFPATLRFDFGDLETVMEGKFRSGHFNGVGLVVSKLFNIIKPHKAYFGQKDLQQCLVVKRLIEDLSFQIELIICPTLRDADGLAMSSRNKRLSPNQRKIAPVLYESLQKAKNMLQTHTPSEIKHEIGLFLAKQTEISLEYFEIADAKSLAPVQHFSDHKAVALCIAVFLGEVRLIDNLVETLR